MQNAIGIFGGTFNPVHLGHKNAIDALNTVLALKQIHWVLSAKPPHKNAVSVSMEQRFDMLKLALQNRPNYIADDCEMRRQRSSYTIDTVESFCSAYSTSKRVLIMGADSLNQIHTWHRAADILALSHIVALSRPGFALRINRHFYAKDLQTLTPNSALLPGEISVLESANFAISSSRIRQQIVNNPSDISALLQVLDKNVLDYITANSLYISQ